jgi:hypothetical protein
MQQVSSPSAEGRLAERVPEARYAYYRRCQLFRRNGEQCKAPAEKGAQICHAHAAQRATAFRRDLERRIVLAEAVAEMRRRGNPECDMDNLLMDFKGVQVTLAVVSRALIAGTIDCKTAGRLLVHLQTMSKLLWMVHRKGREGRKENQGLPQIGAEKRRSSRETAQPESQPMQMELTDAIGRDIGGQDLQVAVETKILTFTQSRRGCRDGPQQQATAA